MSPIGKLKISTFMLGTQGSRNENLKSESTSKSQKSFKKPITKSKADPEIQN